MTVCLILYLNSLSNVFIFDDLHTIQNNLFIKNPRYFGLFFKGRYTSEPICVGMFRPFLMLSFAFNYYFSRLNPAGYRLINILIHFLNATLLYSLLRCLKKGQSFGLILFLCLLFCAHPVNTEALSYIACRSDLLVTFLILFGFLCFIHYKLFLSGLLFILALLSKETALVFPFLVFGYDFIFRKKTDKKQFIFYIFLIGAITLYWIYRHFIFGTSILSPLSSPLRSLWSNILIQSAISLFYLRLFFWPCPLDIHHSNFSNLQTIPFLLISFSILTIFVMAVLVSLLRKKHPLLSLGIFWLLIGFLPKFYAILSYPAMEHHFYLPSIGIYFILSVLFRGVYLKFRRQFVYFAILIIGISGILTVFRNFEWKDALTLYQKTLKRNPSSALAHNELGIEYSRLGLDDAAEKEFRKALVLSNFKNESVKSLINLGHLYTNQKRYEEAIGELNKALSIAPDYYLIYQNLGVTYARMHQKQKTEEIWKKALSLNPLDYGSKIDLGLLYLEQKKLKEAKYYFQEAIKSNPDESFSYFGLGRVLEQELDLEGAINAYKKSNRLNPAYPYTYYYLGMLYAKIELKQQALRELKEAVRLKPDFAEAHNNLAVLYASMQPPNLDLARQHAKRAQALGYEIKEGFLDFIKER